MKARAAVSKGIIIDKIDRRIYGSFIEHLGRAVYNGIYEPSHNCADDMGFRQDVINEVKELNVPLIRYPGGNFVSGYNWEDGTGPKDKRPQKLDLAWFSIETNQVGIDDFHEWAKRADAEVMMAVNLGTRGPDEARNLIEYCNGKEDTYYANMRRQNGYDEPFEIKLWCLGNEMDGPWQICHKTAEEYARVATETAKVLKWVDSSIELVACGSSDHNMPTFGSWERTVLSHTYDYIDYLSLHCYYGNSAKNTPDFLARAEDMDRFIKEIASICDEVKLQKKSNKTVNLSFDEWNVWYRTKGEEKTAEKWQYAPSLLEEKYSFEDALLVGCMLNTLQSNCDRVKIGCLAQLVNVIAPIMTEIGGGTWRQTIFYPYMYASLYGQGSALRVECECDTYKSSEGWDVPYLHTSFIHNDKANEVVAFVINRSLDCDIDFEISLGGFEGYKLSTHIELYSDELSATNTKACECVRPEFRAVDSNRTVKLKKHSWNMLIFR